MSDLSQVVNEYGAAIRGDWSTIGGRSIRGGLEWIAEAIDGHHAEKDLVSWRDTLGICLAGGGHWCGKWHGYCTAGEDEYDCNCECTK